MKQFAGLSRSTERRNREPRARAQPTRRRITQTSRRFNLRLHRARVDCSIRLLEAGARLCGERLREGAAGRKGPCHVSAKDLYYVLGSCRDVPADIIHAMISVAPQHALEILDFRPNVTFFTSPHAAGAIR